MKSAARGNRHRKRSGAPSRIRTPVHASAPSRMRACERAIPYPLDPPASHAPPRHRTASLDANDVDQTSAHNQNPILREIPRFGGLLFRRCRSSQRLPRSNTSRNAPIDTKRPRTPMLLLQRPCTRPDPLTADDGKRSRMYSRRARNRAREFRDQAFCAIKAREGRGSALQTAHSTAFSVISDFVRCPPASGSLKRFRALAT